MAPKNKNRNNEDLKQEDILQAVVIADSFNVRFGPVTKDKPRTLLPLVNTPLLDYTLQALAASGVQEVFVVCCHLGDQVREHIKKSKWQQCGSPMTVSAIMSDSCLSLGDALREVDAKSLIRTDFILITGDLVSNMDIGQVVKEHKARTAGKDKSSVMTLMFLNAQPGHRSRTKEDDMFLVEDAATGRLLYFKKTLDSRKVQLPIDILLEHDDVMTHNDLLDCHISVCSPCVPTLFTDNFDYQTRDDFVKGILINEEIMGNKIHVSIVRDKYAARVCNMQTYDSISKDVISRWTYPLVPDLYGSDSDSVKYHSHNIYLSKDVKLARGSELQRDVVVGSGSSVGCGSTISGCVIGRNCTIGENVHLRNSFLWDNVRVEGECEVDTALLCGGVTVHRGTVVKPGVILAWGVEVGPSVTIPQGTQLMKEQQRDDFDDSFDDEEGKEDQQRERPQEGTESQNYGTQSKAFEFKPHVDSDDEDEAEVVECAWGLGLEESNLHETDSESEEEEEESEGDDEFGGLDDSEDSDDDQVDGGLGFNVRAVLAKRNTDFFTELVDTLQRGQKENIKEDNLILEINSLKHAYTVPIDDVIACLPGALYAMGAATLRVEVSADAQVVAEFKKNISRYTDLLSNYNKSLDSQTATINGLGDFVIRHEELRPRLGNMLNFLYEEDIISERSIFGWFGSTRHAQGSNEERRHTFLKEQVKQFVTWLQEAEEESSDEDDNE